MEHPLAQSLWISHVDGQGYRLPPRPTSTKETSQPLSAVWLPATSLVLVPAVDPLARLPLRVRADTRIRPVIRDGRRSGAGGSNGRSPTARTCSSSPATVTAPAWDPRASARPAGSSSITPPAPFCLSGRNPVPASPASRPRHPGRRVTGDRAALSCCMEPSPRAGASGRRVSGGMTALAGWWWRCTTALKCG